MKKKSLFEKRVDRLDKLVQKAYNKMTYPEVLNPYQIDGLVTFCAEIVFQDSKLLPDELEAVDQISKKYKEL